MSFSISLVLYFIFYKLKIGGKRQIAQLLALMIIMNRYILKSFYTNLENKKLAKQLE